MLLPLCGPKANYRRNGKRLNMLLAIRIIRKVKSLASWTRQDCRPDGLPITNISSCVKWSVYQQRSIRDTI